MQLTLISSMIKKKGMILKTQKNKGMNLRCCSSLVFGQASNLDASRAHRVLLKTPKCLPVELVLFFVLFRFFYSFPSPVVLWAFLQSTLGVSFPSCLCPVLCLWPVLCTLSWNVSLLSGKKKKKKNDLRRHQPGVTSKTAPSAFSVSTVPSKTF